MIGQHTSSPRHVLLVTSEGSSLTRACSALCDARGDQLTVVTNQCDLAVEVVLSDTVTAGSLGSRDQHLDYDAIWFACMPDPLASLPEHDADYANVEYYAALVSWMEVTSSAVLGASHLRPNYRRAAALAAFDIWCASKNVEADLCSPDKIDFRRPSCVYAGCAGQEFVLSNSVMAPSDALRATKIAREITSELDLDVVGILISADESGLVVRYVCTTSIEVYSLIGEHVWLPRVALDHLLAP